MPVDAITREIMENGLSAAADEMSLALYRTAYSTIVRDCLDYSTSLTDANGDMIAQGCTIPMHLGAVPTAMAALLAKYEGNINENDIFIMNDPFDGGMHIPDIFIVKPIFAKGVRVAFAVSTAHHLDMGGRVAGGACDNTEIYHDGLRIPWVKLYDRGTPNEIFMTILRANIRVPHMTVGDIRAQIAACYIGERSIHELVARYGAETFRDCTADLIAYTERLVRAELATWPKGKYSFTDYLDQDGCGGPPVKFHITLSVEGDTLIADFTGSSPQMRGAMNCTKSVSISTVAIAVRSVMPEAIPNNAGIFRAIKIIAPAGTVTNAVMPAASTMRGVSAFRMLDGLFGALAQFLPERVYAAGEGGNSLIVITTPRPGQEPSVYFELFTGTWGGRPDRDGNDGLCSLANIASNIPIEQAEADYPIHIERYGYVPDSGGAGKFRGGMALERDWRLLGADEAVLCIRSDRRDHPPYGLLGGSAGSPSNNIVHHANGSTSILPTMVTSNLKPGERLQHVQASGGGYGNPLERTAAAVAKDVKNEMVSVQAAAEHYGVVIKPGTCEIDEKATTELRSNMRKRRGTPVA